MNKNNKIISLIAAASLLIIAAIAVYAIQLGYFGPANTTLNQKRSRSEVRAVQDVMVNESTPEVTTE